MFALFIHFLVLQAWCLIPSLCIRPQDLSEEQHRELKKYIYELDKATDSSWKEPNNIFEDVPTFEPTYQSDYQKEDKVQESSETGTCNKNGEDCKEIKPVLISNTEYLKSSPKPEMPENNTVYLQRWLKMFLNKFRNINGNLGSKVINIRIGDESLNRLHSMLNSKTLNFLNADNVISTMLLDLTVHDELKWYEVILSYWKPIFSVILVALVSKLYIMYPKFTLFIFFIVLCTAWQWKQLYEEAIAKKYADLEQIDYPSACKRHELGIVENLRLWFHGLTVSQGTCRDYYKAVMVDPFWEVTPSMALSAALSKFVFYPLEVLAETANNFVKLLFKDLSIISQLVVILVLLFLLLIFANYRIRMPFFLTLEPVNKIASLMVKNDTQPVSVTHANFSVGNSSTNLGNDMLSNSDGNFNHGVFQRQHNCVRDVCSYHYDKLASVSKKSIDRMLLSCDKHSLCSQNDDSQMNLNLSQSSVKNESPEDSEIIELSNQKQEDPPCLLSCKMGLLKIDNQTSNSENMSNDLTQPKLLESSNQKQDDPPCLLTCEMDLLKIDDQTLNSENMSNDLTQPKLLESSNQKQEDPPCLLTCEMDLLRIDDQTSNSENMPIDLNQPNLLAREVENADFVDYKAFTKSSKDLMNSLKTFKEQISTKVPSSDKLIDL